MNSVVEVRLAFSGGGMVYERISGDFFLTQFESGNRGVISPLCDSLNRGTLSQPVQVGGTSALRFSVTGGQACSSNLTARCLTIETANKQSDGRFLIRQSDVFEIDMQDGLRKGMVSRHEHKSTVPCKTGHLTNVSRFQGVF